MMMGEFFFENEQFETTLPELLLQSILKVFIYIYILYIYYIYSVHWITEEL